MERASSTANNKIINKIFIVEDDEDIRELTAYALNNSGFDCECYEDSQQFFKGLQKSAALPEAPLPRIVLLDIMLPGEDGLTILKKMRQQSQYSHIPVIMLTAKGSEADKVKGLNLGADDYIAKPFGITELIARIKAVLRRTNAPPDSSARLTYNNLILDSQRRDVTINNQPIALTYMEFELLQCLMLNAGIVLSRDKLMNLVWGYDYQGESRTIDMHIGFLRQKLGPCGNYIKTIRNVGYKLGDT